MRFTLGTHNTHDGAAAPSMFADVVLFTEAAITHRDRARFIASGYSLVVCRDQRDLAIGYRRSVFERAGQLHYGQVVEGVPGVTPNRGTAWLPLDHRSTGDRFAFVFEHRINAAFPPYVRGEAKFRRAKWKEHTDHTLDLMDRLATSGYIVPAGGDVNTPQGVRGYWPHPERGHLFDRLALTQPTGPELPHRWFIGDGEYLSPAGSDHPRLRATITRTSTR